MAGTGQSYCIAKRTASVKLHCHSLAAWRQQIEQKCLTSSRRLSCCGRVKSSLSEFSTSRSSLSCLPSSLNDAPAFLPAYLNLRGTHPQNSPTYNPSLINAVFSLASSLPSVTFNSSAWIVSFAEPCHLCPALPSTSTANGHPPSALEYPQPGAFLSVPHFRRRFLADLSLSRHPAKLGSLIFEVPAKP